MVDEAKIHRIKLFLLTADIHRANLQYDWERDAIFEVLLIDREHQIGSEPRGRDIAALLRDLDYAVNTRPSYSQALIDHAGEHLSYSQRLETAEWAECRRRIICRDYARCQVCDQVWHSSSLEVHHTVYREGILPWEYLDSDLRTLCSTCHSAVHQVPRRS